MGAIRHLASIMAHGESELRLVLARGIETRVGGQVLVNPEEEKRKKGWGAGRGKKKEWKDFWFVGGP